MSSIRQSAAREDSDSDEDEGGDERTLFNDANSDAALAQSARGMYSF